MAYEPYSRPKKPRWDLSQKQMDQLEGFGAIRLPMERIAAIFGVSKRTLERALKKNPAARAALERGTAIASANVRQTAFTQATSGNTTMLIFWLKTQEGFREKDREEDAEEKRRDATRRTDEERQAELNRMRKALDDTDPSESE